MSRRATPSGREVAVTKKLVSAATHPVRGPMIVRIAARPASIGELAAEIGEPPSKVRYHARQMIEDGLIEVAGKRPTRGTTETLYRPATPLMIHDVEFSELGSQAWRQFAERTITLALREILASFRSGRFAVRADGAAVHMRLFVDEQGWKEMAKVHEETLQSTERIKAESAERLRVRGESGLLAASSHFLYELQDRDD